MKGFDLSLEDLNSIPVDEFFDDWLLVMIEERHQGAF